MPLFGKEPGPAIWDRVGQVAGHDGWHNTKHTQTENDNCTGQARDCFLHQTSPFTSRITLISSPNRIDVQFFKAPVSPPFIHQPNFFASGQHKILSWSRREAFDGTLRVRRNGAGFKRFRKTGLKLYILLHKLRLGVADPVKLLTC